MITNDVGELYFNWMASKAIPNERERLNYNKLLNMLATVEYRWRFTRDQNRYIDGVDLRRRFAWELGICEEDLHDGGLMERPCSVLEMMLALAIKCEEEMMADLSYTDQTGKWFSTMIKSLNLTRMTDSEFDPDEVKYKLDIFMDGVYQPNGCGGLFTIEDINIDMRTLELWYQMCYYLNSITRPQRY